MQAGEGACGAVPGPETSPTRSPDYFSRSGTLIPVSFLLGIMNQGRERGMFWGRVCVLGQKGGH